MLLTGCGPGRASPHAAHQNLPPSVADVVADRRQSSVEAPPDAVTVPAPTDTVTAQDPTDAFTAQAVADAYSVGAARTLSAAVALLDLQSNTLYSAGDIDETYASASVVKVFIAARLLVDGQADDPAIRDLMWDMITVSDDDAGTHLYQLAGSEDLVPWIAQRYGITGIRPTSQPGVWGLTRITARAMVAFYAAVIHDPVVAPWLLEAMSHTQPYGSDGFAQHFGLPSAAASWRVKQGWMCCLEHVTRMHSTGYIDNDRYAVALLAAGDTAMYGREGRETLTLMAQALLPAGTVPIAA